MSRRRAMVLAIRRGGSIRRVARRFGVSHTTVRRWAGRVLGERLDRADFADRASGSPSPANRTPQRMERRIVAMRRRLAERSALGECGAAAIRRELLAAKIPGVPGVRTIGRILQRHGLLDGRRRVRRPPPPKGWYLPEVAAGKAEIDSFDTVTDLVIKGGRDVTVLNAVSLHGGLAESWPEPRITAQIVENRLLEHWRKHGLPAYAKFDNDTVFQGGHRWPDTYGRVTRTCLRLGVIPVFAPPRETGFQAEIEAFNGRWQKSVWQRFTHRDMAGLRRQSRRFIDAHRTRAAERIAAAPERRAFPEGFTGKPGKALAGTVVFLRRTDSAGRADCLGHRWKVSRNWTHRLVRIEVDLTAGKVSMYSLRRREPASQRLLKTFRYQVPQHKFTE